MMFWVIAIVLVMLVMLAVYVPLNRAAKADTTKPALMQALVAELSEINADKGVRFANAGEADAARAEVGRRLLALEATTEKSAPKTGSPALFALFALVPILAVPLYLQLGQPEYADQSFAARTDNQTGNTVEQGQQEVANLISRVEQRLKDRPDDAEGWAVVAPIYFRMQRIDDSFNAYAKAIQFHKGTPQQKSRLMADRAEIMVAKAEGKVNADAASEFNAALQLDKDNQKALFYLAVNLEQSGKVDVARANWQTLITRFRDINPPWLQVAEQRLAGLNGSPATSQTGPTSDQVEAAGEMTAEQRNEMINGMVDGLAAKLKDNPQDQLGWVKLIRARMVMNDKAQALIDLATARSLFAEGTQGRAEIESVAQSMGL